MAKNKHMDKTIFLRKLGKNIRRICRDKNFNQDKIYLEAGFSSGTMSKIERGLVDVKIFTLYRIAETIGVSLEELVKID